MEIIYYGHSCFEVKVNNKYLLFDPFITANTLASKIDVNNVKADYILISHGHQDHIGDAMAIAKRTGAKIVSCHEITEWFKNQGIQNIHGMNIGGKWMFDFGNIKCVAAVHSSSLPDGSYGGNPIGFIIESSQGNFYYAGDTALTYDMKLIGEYRKLNFAFLPIGDNYTMSVDNAIIASDFINCHQIVGMHYDTFEHIKIDHKKAIESFNRAGKELKLFEIGQTFEM